LSYPWFVTWLAELESYELYIPTSYLPIQIFVIGFAITILWAASALYRIFVCLVPNEKYLYRKKFSFWKISGKSGNRKIFFRISTSDNVETFYAQSFWFSRSVFSISPRYFDYR